MVEVEKGICVDCHFNKYCNKNKRVRTEDRDFICNLSAERIYRLTEDIDREIDERNEKTEEKLDSHYDAELNGVRLDPYQVADIWKMGKRDDTGCLVHILKTIARFGDKNSVEREIKSIHSTILRMAEIRGVELKNK